MKNNLVTIGKIVAPHGVRGDVRVIPLTDFPERFSDLKSIVLDTGVTLTLENVKFHKQFVLLKFKNHDDINSIEGFRGKLINVDRSETVKLSEGSYYIFDIVGLKVFTDTEEYIGEVTDVLQTGSNDVYVVEQPGEKPVLIPALKEVVQDINITNKKMIVRLQEWE